MLQVNLLYIFITWNNIFLSNAFKKKRVQNKLSEEWKWFKKYLIVISVFGKWRKMLIFKMLRN